MAENRQIIHRNPKFASSLVKSLQKLGEKKDESPPVPPGRPNLVTVPVPELIAPPPLAVEGKQRGKFSHPAIRWSLYALGGYLIIRWVWKKWKPEDEEHKK